MYKKIGAPFLLLCFLLNLHAQSHNSIEKSNFVSPPKDCKPMPFWHINGELTTDGIVKQITDAKEKANFSGITLLPLLDKGSAKPGTSPKYLSKEYFDRYSDVLKTAKKLDMNVIMYDDNDFPSGMAGGNIKELYPEHAQKRLFKTEKDMVGPTIFSDTIPSGQLLGAVAMNTENLKRINLKQFIKNNKLEWKCPNGNWKVMFFTVNFDIPHKKYPVADYLDTAAVRQMVNQTYEKYYEKFSSYFGNVIKLSFFDDIGFWKHHYMWTGKFNEKFKALNGYCPETFYPALWYNIGPATEAVRYAFFNTRAELLAEGFPKVVGEWTKKHNIKDTGHPPGNYDPSPVDMNGDIFKFYRHTAIPLADAIIDYQFGQNGHKLVSSAAEYYDKPLMGVEIYGAFKEAIFDSLMLYRPMMEMFIRGANLVIPHGMWYNSNPGMVYIPPLVSPYSAKIVDALPKYSDFVGRASYMLRGGRRVSEIGLLYPIENLSGWYRFDDPAFKRQGFFVSPETDYQTVSGILTNEVRKDFTFVHPEYLCGEKYTVEQNRIKLNNKENYQDYRVMIISGCNIISLKTLQKLKKFYDNGGVLISTTQLPFKSSEIGKDKKVIALINEVFGINPLKQNETSSVVENGNKNGGKAVFIKNPTSEDLTSTIDIYYPTSDVQFVSNLKLKTNMGKFSYMHKIKDGKHIYYFANSSDEVIETEVLLRGKINPEFWNPHNGSVAKVEQVSYISKNNQTYTKFNLKLSAVASTFVVAGL